MSIKYLSYALLGSMLVAGAGQAAAAITCTVTPEYSALAEGETLTLAALCNGALSSIDWRMDGVSVSGAIPMPGHVAGKPAYFTTPVGAGGANNFAFTAVGVPASTADAFGGSNTARVTVKPASAVVAKAAGLAAPMTPVAASCGSANGGTVATMPTGAAACGYGKPELQIAGTSDFSWTCESLTGGADASCYAKRGTATAPTPTPTISANGACGTAAKVVALVPPSAGGCAVGTAGPVVTTSVQYSWACSGTGTGSTASCSAPRGYAVTATAGAGGTITPASKTVAAYAATAFTVTPSTGYTAKVTGCNGTLSGTTYTTSPISAGCLVSATFTGGTTATAPAPGSCPVVDPTKVVVVDTNVSAGYYPRTDVVSPNAATIYAYKFKTLNVAEIGNWVVTQLTSATTGKLVKITQCPGVLDTANTTGACERFTAESTRIDYAVNRPDISTRSTCHLQPGTVYYANVVSKYAVSNFAYNCISGPKCGFSASGE